MADRKPLVGVICDRKIVGPHPFHMAGEKYINALLSASHVTPVLIPALGNTADLEEWLAHMDGVFLTGAYSMMNPVHYGAALADDEFETDADRDNTSLTLIKMALSKGMPLFGVCRGFQELVVATGGTLNQKVHEDPRYRDHREEKEQTLAQQYSKAHDVVFTEGGLLEQLCGCQTAKVNSLHVQGAGTIGSGAFIEAIADDGLVQAISVIGSEGFAMAVQWHPEWQVLEDQVSTKMFAGFGEACKQYQHR